MERQWQDPRDPRVKEGKWRGSQVSNARDSRVRDESAKHRKN